MSGRSCDPFLLHRYWDFTKEGEAILKAGLGPSKLPTVSDVFTAEWFGASDELSHISDGRWAHTPAHRAAIDPATGAAVGVHNSYGFIRAPWNNANDREVVRHMSDVCGLEPVNKPIPTCKTHYAVMSQTSFPTFQLEIAGYGHGPMHVNTGGVYGGCAGAMDKLYTNYENEMKKASQPRESMVPRRPPWVRSPSPTLAHARFRSGR